MKKILPLFLLVVISKSSFAQYIAGSEIYYEKQGNRKYKVTAYVYRECDFPSLTGISGYVIADTVQRTISFTRVSISKINDTCGNPCNIQNQASNPGIERHIFEATVDFNNPSYKAFITQNKCMVSFAIRNGGRDGRATTHNGGTYYNEATVNICDSTIQNSSPRFSQDPKFYAQSNWTLYYSPGPLDTADYDSLVFTLEPVLTNTNTPITYKNGHTALLPYTPYCGPNPGTLNCRPLPTAKPARGLFFDSIYCQFVFTPTDNTEKGYSRIKISEYRKINGQMTLLGSVSRDMMMDFTKLIWNTPPVMTPGTRLLSVCGPGVSQLFKTTDDPFLPMQTVADTTNIQYDNGYSNGLFVLDSNQRARSGTVFLYPDTSGRTYPQYFTLTVTDKACNLNMTSYTYKVQNSQYFDYTKHYTIDSCNNITGYIKPNDTTLTLYGNIFLIEPGGNTKTISSPYRLNKNGTYYIRYQYSTNLLCYNTKYDTFTISNTIPNPQFNYTKDTSVCSSYPFNIRFYPSKMPQLQSWSWYKNDTLVNKTDSMINGTIFQASGITLKAVVGQNCVAESTRVFLKKQTTINPFPNQELAVCRNSDFIAVANIVGAKFPITTRWKYLQTDTSINGNQVTLKSSTIDSALFTIRMTDDNHCIVMDTQMVVLQPEIQFDLLTDKSKYCADSSVNIRIANYQGNAWRRSDWYVNNIPIGQSDVLDIDQSFTNTAVVGVYVKDSTNCAGYDSLIVNPIPHPLINLTTIGGICKGDSATVIASLMDLTSNLDLKWYMNGIPYNSNDTFISIKADNSSVFKLVAGNDSMCYNDNTVNLIVQPLPNVKIHPDSLFNRYALIQMRSQNKHKAYLWSTGDMTDTAEIWAYELGAPGKHLIWLQAKDSLGCTATDSIYIFTDRFTSLNFTTDASIKAYPNPVESTLYIQSNKATDYKMYDVNGKLIVSGTIEIGTSSIDVKHLEKGVYTLEIEGMTFKIVKI